MQIGVFTGFNSQRDGILHFFINARFDVKIVSIPNGMEFYDGGDDFVDL